MIERYSLWNMDKHSETIDQMLEEDVRNNSVWSFKYFILFGRLRSEALKRGISMKELWREKGKEIVQVECKEALERRLPDNWGNEACWAYIRGFLATSEADAEKSWDTNAKRWSISDLPEIVSILDKWSAEDDSADDESFLMRKNGLKDNRFFIHT